MNIENEEMYCQMPESFYEWLSECPVQYVEHPKGFFEFHEEEHEVDFPIISLGIF